MRRHLTSLALLLCLLLSGCSSASTKVAGWYITRQIDGYVDLTSAQRDLVRPAVDREVDRMRREDLPRWIDLLRGVRDQIQHGPSDAATLALQLRYDQLLDAAVMRLAEQFAPLFAELSKEQIDHFEKKLVEHVDKMFKEQKLPPEERREEQDEALIDGIEKITGDLSDDQVSKILSNVHAQPDDRPLRYKNDRARAFAFIKFLRADPSREAIEAELKRLWHTRFDALGPDFALETRRDRQRRALLSLDTLITPAQRKHAVEHLNEQILRAKKWVLPRADG
ncbi:MAG TPA: DUF6279 family lipoprotein [Polyangiales bacterium]